MQELVVSGMVRMRKVLGTLNPADILTKYVPKDTLKAFGFHEKTERERVRESFLLLCFLFSSCVALLSCAVMQSDMSVMYTLLADMYTCSLCSACLVIVGDG